MAKNSKTKRTPKEAPAKSGDGLDPFKLALLASNLCRKGVPHREAIERALDLFEKSKEALNPLAYVTKPVALGTEEAVASAPMNAALERYTYPKPNRFPTTFDVFLKAVCAPSDRKGERLKYGRDFLEWQHGTYDSLPKLRETPMDEFEFEFLCDMWAKWRKKHKSETNSGNAKKKSAP